VSAPGRSWSIRRADPSDVAAIARLCGAFGYRSTEEDVAERIRPIARSVSHGLFVADDPVRGVVGWIHVFAAERVESGPFAEIGGLVVDETCRGAGIGSELVARARTWAADAGLPRLRVRTREERGATRRFYAGAGFEHVKTQWVFDSDTGAGDVVASRWGPGAEARMQDRTVVATVRYRHEAELVRGLLESAGIEAAIEGDDFGGENPGLGFVRGVRVLVGPGDAEAAMELLASADLGITPGVGNPQDGDEPV
jgi:GNAT superfamily N-acetyltransferase